MTEQRAVHLTEALEQALQAVTAAEDAGDTLAAARHRAAAQALAQAARHRVGHQPHDDEPSAA